MKARILEKSEEKLWEKFIEKHPLSTIHQSPAWGHFQGNVNSRGKYWIIVLEDKDKIIGGTLLIRHKLPKNYSWLYAARGPLIDYNSKEAQKQLDTLITAIKPLAIKHNAIFLRIDPPILKENKFPKFKKCCIFYKHFQPQYTLILDISKSEDDILSQMKQKGRYNIRLAEKKSVKVHTTDTSDKEKFSKDLSDLYEILQDTAKRDKFSTHDKNFYETMLQSLVPTEKASLYLAEYEGEIIAGMIVTFFKDTATYYYGASSSEHRNVMAPYLLHWHAIKDAKSKHLKYYDLFGIAPEDEKNHPWQGVTQFKLKFGGEKISYHPAQEYPFKKFLYLIYRLYKKLKK